MTAAASENDRVSAAPRSLGANSGDVRQSRTPTRRTLSQIPGPEQQGRVTAVLPLRYANPARPWVKIGTTEDMGEGPAYPSRGLPPPSVRPGSPFYM
jgi:hypothetical protein